MAEHTATDMPIRRLNDAYALEEAREPILERIRDDEQRMADWLEETLPRTVQSTLQAA